MIRASTEPGLWLVAMSGALVRASVVFFAVVALLAVYAPLIASGHPVVMREVSSGDVSSPLLARLSSVDVVLAVVTSVCLVWIAAPTGRSRLGKLGWSSLLLGQGLLIATVCGAVASVAQGREAPVWMREASWLPVVCAVASSLIATAVALLIVRGARSARVMVACVLVGMVGAGAGVWKWERPPETFPYGAMERAGEVEATYTLVPFSPNQRPTDRDESLLGAMSRYVDAEDAAARAHRVHVLGTDAFGQDVLSQLIHACRVALTVGFVATGVAFGVGVLIGAVMGYFGGLVDGVGMRLVEVFMSLPVLFVLIVAAGLFPRSVLVMSALIGLFSWQGVARLVRAEFMSMREADFVSAARAQGVSNRSILFRHMLPSGVSSSIVDASFTVSAAVLAEAVISYLGFGPVDRASWGRLLSQAVSETGGLVPHLAVAPGLMIFVTVLSANAIGSSMNESLDPSRGDGS